MIHGLLYRSPELYIGNREFRAIPSKMSFELSIRKLKIASGGITILLGLFSYAYVQRCSEEGVTCSCIVVHIILLPNFVGMKAQ